MEEDTQKEVVQNREGKVEDYIGEVHATNNQKTPSTMLERSLSQKQMTKMMSSLFHFIVSLERCQGNYLHE